MSLDPNSIQWDAAPATSPAPAAPSTPKRIYGAPEQPKQPAPPPNSYQQGQDTFANEQGFRKEFYSLPEVQEYQVAARTYANSLQAGDDASGDHSLIVAYAKMLDPTSVVREGEAASVAGADSTIGRSIAKLSKEFGLEGGGTLSPDIRAKIRREMRTLTENYGAGYELQRTQYEQWASQYGFAPERVVGAHILDPYRATIDGYWKSHDEKNAMVGGSARNGPPTFNNGYFDENGNPLPDDYQGEVFDREGNSQGLVATVSYEGKTYEQQRAEAYAKQREELSGKPGLGQLVREGATFGLQDEGAGVGWALGRALTGDFDIAGNYRAGRDGERLRTEKAREEQGWVGTGAELLGGGASVVGKAGQVFGAARNLAKAGQPITRPGIRNALAIQGGKDGARVGAVGGFGYDQSDSIEGTLVNTAGGAVAGGMLGYGAQKVGNALAGRTPSAANAPRAPIAKAGQAEGVTVNRAMMDPNSNNAVTKADASLIGGRTVQREMGQIEGQIEGRVNDLGRGGSAKLDPATGGVDRVALGDTVKGASERFIDKSGKAARVKYDRAERLAGDARVEPRQSVQALDSMIAKLSETPQSFQAEIAYLKGLRKDLGKDLSVGALRRMRTALRKKISKGDLVYGEDEARVKEILDVAADDIRAGLLAQGKGDAARAFDAADKAYRGRMDYIENVIQRVIGKRQSNLSAEDVAKKFQSLSANDTRALRKLYATLSQEERDDVAATFAETLGRNNKDGFTVTQFLRQTSGMSDETARTLFGNEGVQSIKNLRLIGKEVERVTGAMNSRTSKSGVASYRDWMWSLLASGGGTLHGGVTQGVVVGGGIATATAANQGFSARLLMSPKIQKWLLQAPRTSNSAAIDRHFGLLANIAKAEPALAGDIDIFRKTVLGAANDNAAAGSPLAAEDQNAKEGR